MPAFFAILLSPFINALIRAILGTAVATATYFWLNNHLKPHFDDLISSINGAVSDAGSINGLIGDFYSFLGVSDMLLTITSAISACFAIKLYVISIKAFGTKSAA